MPATADPYDHPPEPGPPRTANLADILERVLDKGIVIAGDIRIDLLDIELLTIRLRLFVSSVDTAKRAGIDWWEADPSLSARAAGDALAEENRVLRERLAEVEAALPSTGSSAPRAGSRAGKGRTR
ncbi:gas vesicle protein [Streptomyces alkaliphilus]|uniref:gas vesicle protein n=1 Tax=Streptomyces alkaliphilus TaxID=1472722 RepID=UPI001180ED45|nr:gas vesicle protein [Streptomyces alkaliphilus]MQS06825.1 gas vesicle protein [Streptomyces alkaliphilus]